MKTIMDEDSMSPTLLQLSYLDQMGNRARENIRSKEDDGNNDDLD
eukprot:CAMPEP_0116059964 /NCGR_PEP_ID=MMETSP0322-20121206/6124_1 /TAXON_ID=163516 /ORGANISM="Leptocylindrus danicus var. apora, Strain B651" /LENGTH=44 /DNA_ID= /DNA_START= /DNA_END= /DNA_ORIENTATION=